MISPEAEEKAILYVLGEMSPDEARAFAQLLESDPELAALVKELEDTFGAVAESLPQVEPPPGLRDKILSQVAAQAQAKSKSSKLASRLLLTALSGALIVMISLYFSSQRNWKDTTTALQNDFDSTSEAYNALVEKSQAQASANEQLAAEKNRLTTELTAKEAEIERLTAANSQLISDLKAAYQAADLARLKLAALHSSVDESYEAALVWSPLEQGGMIEITSLPANEPGKQYQVWIIDEGNPNPISGGVFGIDLPDFPGKATFAATQPVKNAVAFAISVEKTGGAPAPEGPIVLQYGL